MPLHGVELGGEVADVQDQVGQVAFERDVGDADPRAPPFRYGLDRRDDAVELARAEEALAVVGRGGDEEAVRRLGIARITPTS